MRTNYEPNEGTIEDSGFSLKKFKDSQNSGSRLEKLIKEVKTINKKEWVIKNLKIISS